MKINKIELKSFRNYQSLTLNLSTNLNVFIGDNGQGKTNLLEAIYYLSATRSFKNIDDQAMIQSEAPFSKVLVQFDDNQLMTISSVIHPNGKSFFLGDKVVQKTSDIIGRLNTLLFTPQDLELIYASPKIRRKFLDLEIGKVSKKYLLNLKSYYKILKERNAYLKEDTLDFVYLNTITEQLAEASIVIVNERKALVQFLNEHINDIISKISMIKETVTIFYQTVTFKDKDSLLKVYDNSLNRDIMFKQTSIGVHKDDFIVNMNNRSAFSYASQGQIRIIVLAIKLCLIRYIFNKTGSYPILLLDDVLSELDITNQKKLLELIPNDIQTIITTTDIQSIKNSIDRELTLFYVKEGTIQSIKEVI